MLVNFQLLFSWQNLFVKWLLYISTSVWVPCTPNAGQNMLSQNFLCKKLKKGRKSMIIEATFYKRVCLTLDVSTFFGNWFDLENQVSGCCLMLSHLPPTKSQTLSATQICLLCSPQFVELDWDFWFAIYIFLSNPPTSEASRRVY